jgi:transposase
VPLDNGATERAMRGLALGRKNHYGSRSRCGTEVAALYYSLMETAKLRGVDPKRSLREAALAAPRGEPTPLPNQLEQSGAG